MNEENIVYARKRASRSWMGTAQDAMKFLADSLTWKLSNSVSVNPAFTTDQGIKFVNRVPGPAVRAVRD